jgi:hypothetical protein
MPRMTPVQYEIYLAGVLAKKKAPPRPSLVPVVIPEADLHDAILSECRRRGLRVIHSRMDRASTVAVGAPDFVIAMPRGRTLWIECKSSRGVIRHEQAAWLATLKDFGHQACVIRSLQEFLTLLAEPTNQPVIHHAKC